MNNFKFSLFDVNIANANNKNKYRKYKQDLE